MVTLLRSVGWLSRDDLRTRAAHAGPGYDTPDAQCLGLHRFRYALLPHAGPWHKSDVVHQALAMRVPLRVLAVPRHGGTLPAAHSFVHCAGALVSALTIPPAGQGVVLRVYNPFPWEETAVITTSLPLAGVQEVNLAGDEIGVVAPVDGGFSLPLRAFQIRTVQLQIAPAT